MTPPAACKGTRPRLARGRRAEVLGSLLLCAAMFGCVTYEGTLQPNGSGTFEMTYPMPPNSTVDGEKRRYSSAHVTVDSLTTDGKTGTVKGHYDDATKLSTAEAFKNVTVTRTPEGANERIVVRVVNPDPKPIPNNGLPGPKFTFHLPGAVSEANNGGKISGDSVSWSFALSDWVKNPVNELSALYVASANGATGTSGKDTPAKDTAAKDSAAKDAAAKPAAKAKQKAAH